MEGIPDRRGRRIFTERLQSTVSADSADLSFRASEAGATGRRQGCQRQGKCREHAEEERRVRTRDCPPKRIGRLEPPGPPVSVIQGASPRAKGRGASFEEMLGTNVGASTRSRNSGKQKSVEHIGLVLRVLSQDRPQEGEAARRKLLDPLTRRAGAHLQTRGAAKGGGAACRKARGLCRRGAG